MRPGPKWREVLLDPDTLQWLLDLLPSLSAAAHPQAAASPLAAAARQLLTKFASIAGDIFPKAAPGARCGGVREMKSLLAASCLCESLGSTLLLLPLTRVYTLGVNDQ